MRNIYLVGFMGTGKTAVGKALAEELGFSFVDLDSLIEERAGLEIVDIFADKGEVYFRSLESDVLKEISDMKGVGLSDNELGSLKDD